MNEQELEGLRAELTALREEVKDLKEIISGLYYMMIDEDEDEGSPIQTGRYLN
jgi:cell division protein FtsB